MINLVSEIFSKIKIKESDYQIINMSGSAVYVFNHCGIVVFSSEQMVFKLKVKKTLMVTGEQLSLVEMDNNSVLISGRIASTEVV